MPWRIPGDLPPSDDYRVRIVGTVDQTALGVSEAPFSIVGPSLTLTAPNEGTSWTCGKRQTISWTYEAGRTFPVRIELVKDGVVVSTIAQQARLGANGTGAYRWKVPSDLESGDQYAIRIVNTQDDSCSGTSGTFSIVDPS